MRPAWWTSYRPTQGVPVREESIARLEGTDGHFERVVFTRGDTLDRDAMFCGISRLRQRSDLPAQLGCTTFEDGCVEVSDFGQTSVPGVYAVGDMGRRASPESAVSR